MAPLMVVAIALALAADGQAPPAPALSPVGKWTVEYNQSNCTLSRTFGEAKAPVVFGFQPSVDMTSGELVLFAPGAGAVRRGAGHIVVLPSRESFDIKWASGPLGADRHGVRFDADRAFWEALPRADGLELDIGEPRPVRLTFGPITGALKAVKACGDDLLRSWGANPAGLITPPERTILAMFSPDTYPPDAQRAGQQGRVTALSIIDRQGAVTSCRIVQSSGSASLDAATCADIRHGRFAADASAPANRYFPATVRWILPEG